MTDAPLRIGLLGASRIAERAITDASRETGDLRAAVAARDPARAAAYAAEHDYERAAGGYAELVTDDRLDLVYIGLPNAMHAEWTVAALDAGRHVLTEKPFAANLAEFDRVVERMRVADGWAWEAFHHAHHPVTRRFLEIVASGEVGEPRDVRIRMEMPAPPLDDPRWSFALAGGAVMDLGCYALHALGAIGEALGADPRLVTAEARVADGDSRVDAAVLAEYAIGRVPVSIGTSMVADGWDFSLHLEGDRGSVTAPGFVRPFDDDRVIVSVDGETREERLGTASSYRYQLATIRGLVRSGARPELELERSRRVAARIDELYLACGLPRREGTLGA